MLFTILITTTPLFYSQSSTDLFWIDTQGIIYLFFFVITNLAIISRKLKYIQFARLLFILNINNSKYMKSISFSELFWKPSIHKRKKVVVNSATFFHYFIKNLIVIFFPNNNLNEIKINDSYTVLNSQHIKPRYLLTIFF